MLKRILDLLFPPRCVLCHHFLKSDEQNICSACAKTLPVAEGQHCKQKGEFFDFCISPLYYEGHVRSAIHRFKFSGKVQYAEYFGQLLAESLFEHCTVTPDFITWVPISKIRLRKRGYNQSEALAKAAAVRLELPTQAVLQKKKDNPPQSSLQGAEKRRANVLNMYNCTSPEIVRGKTILLIDDVITTGSTLGECARTLLMAGADTVVCGTIARSKK